MPSRCVVPPLSRWRLAAVAVLTALLLAACATGGTATGEGPAAEATATSETTAAPTTEPDPTSAAPGPTVSAGTVINVADSEFGPMLFDQPGQAIYLFDKETTSQPACYGDCAAAWPPVLTSGPPRPMGAARADLLGTTPRDDGSTQVTYAGHPLYYYAHEDPGEVLCHDVADFGGTWLVVTPEGTPAP